ncbi:MAG: class I SAM-dependent DNA methyltransferase, partial [Verrucomicrobium sp.]
PDKATDEVIETLLVENLNLASLAQWAESFYLRVGTGRYYADKVSLFDSQKTVDAYLLANLAAVRDALVQETSRQRKLSPHLAHAFLGRMLFTCYLCDRGIIKLSDYFKGKTWTKLHEVLEQAADPVSALYDKLFPVLKSEFNSSMFDGDLESERTQIGSEHLKLIQRFLHGDEIGKNSGQPSLGFWAYDFRLIPVETISAIYESFLEGEDKDGKHKAGAFYTPRFLAEMALDQVLQGLTPLYVPGRRYLDPSCGSGIFLVSMFNRLAAEWRQSQGSHEPAPQEKAVALIERLGALCGVDKHPTACRIACFSLYIAFLDQFEPSHVKEYKLQTEKKLPHLLQSKDGPRKAGSLSVVVESWFADFAPKAAGQFDIVIGNPPWAERGSKQLAYEFMEKTPALLKAGGRSCFLLPSKVFLNRTDDFQARWLSSITLEKVIQLADYRHILFKEAKCPCTLVVFTAAKPEETTHQIEYIAPKVNLTDLRDGLISVSSRDRKWIPLREILAATKDGTAGAGWKVYLWGTPFDQKLLDYLSTFPRLTEQVDVLSELRKRKQSRSKRWITGEGCKPYKVDSATKPDRKLRPLDGWKLDDPFVTPKDIKKLITLPLQLCSTLKDHLAVNGYLPDKLYSKPDDALFTPPLVLINNGFSEFAFFESTVRFQHSLQSIACGTIKADNEMLLFLCGVLRSKLARYFIFHTAANLGTERDKAHMLEVLRIPFMLPSDKQADSDAKLIAKKIAASIQKLKCDVEASSDRLVNETNSSEFTLESDHETPEKKRARWFDEQRQRTAGLQAELEPLIYRYFCLSAQEQALVEDTCDIFDQSDTPHSLGEARSIPTLKPVAEAAGLQAYADMLTDKLNEWAKGAAYSTATGGVDEKTGIALVEITQTRDPQPFKARPLSKVLAKALELLQQQARQRQGVLEFQRSGLVFDGARIYLIKPALVGEWTRSAALNDAAEIAAEIAEARRHKTAKK